MSDRREQVWSAVRLLSVAVLLGVAIYLLVALVVSVAQNGRTIAALRRQVSHQTGRIEQLQQFIRSLGAKPPAPRSRQEGSPSASLSPSSSSSSSPPVTPSASRSPSSHPSVTPTRSTRPSHSPSPSCVRLPHATVCVRGFAPRVLAADASFPVVAFGVIVGLLGMAVVLRRRGMR